MSRELHIVGFQVGRETYGVPITSLHEIVRVPEITAVPDAPDYMEGVINLRGKIVSVMDLRKRFGVKESGANRRNRILVVEFNGRLSGLIVDSASPPTSNRRPPCCRKAARTASLGWASTRDASSCCWI
jgi:purine-binding chemotaxis protein CheW